MSKRNDSKRGLGFRLFGSRSSSPAPTIVPPVSTSRSSSGMRGGGETAQAVVMPGSTLAESVRSTCPAPLPRDSDTKLVALAGEGLARQQLSFWEAAYQEIIDDKDDETRAIIAAYDALLDRMAQQGPGDEGGNGESRECARSISDSESAEGGDVIVKRRVGCEEEMRAMAAAKLGEMQEKEWVMRWNGHVFAVREQVTRIVKIMQHMSGLVGQAASSNPSAGLAWAGVCVILPLIINDTEERGAAVDGVEYVARVVARFRTVEDDYLSGRLGRNADFEKLLVSLYRALAYFYMKSACYFARSTPFRTVRGLVAADAWISTLESVKETEGECFRTASMLGCSSSLGKIDKVLEDLSRMEFKGLIKEVEEWLIHDVNVAQLHQAKQPKLASGYDKAGSWLLESDGFKSWEENTGGQFWIKGAVGTGKSSLVAIIVDQMRKTPQSDFAFFYCMIDEMGATQVPKGIEDDVAATRVLRGLLGQLAMSPDRMRIAEEIELAFNRSSQPGALGRVPLSLKDAKDLLVRVINSRRCTTIIVDGLDEVPNCRHLLRTLGDIHESSDAGKLRLLLASQSVVPVDTYFPSANLAVAGGEDSMADMKSFISGRVQQFNETSSVTLSSDISEDIVETLSNKAEGMFKWAELCLARVLDDEKSSTEIAEYWESVKLQEFRGLLVDLVKSYEYLWNKSLPKGDPKERVTVQNAAQRALLWAFEAKGLIQEEYLELQTGEENEAPAGQTLKVCQNFLHAADKRIGALHSSVWDYVSLKVTGRIEEFIRAAESENQSDRSQEIILQEAKEAASSIARCQVATDCLKIVTSRKSIFSGEESEGGSPNANKSWLLHYACRCWTMHSAIVRGREEESDDLLEMRMALFDPANVALLERWVNLYDKDRVPRPPDPLYYAVTTGLDDTVQFVLDNTERSSWTGGPRGKALQLACYEGETSMVREILRKIDVDEGDDTWGTPLHAALAGGQREVYDLLMDEYNADVNAPSRMFGNAVQIALALHKDDLLPSLVNHGALYDPNDYRGRIWAKAWRPFRGWESFIPHRVVLLERILLLVGDPSPVPVLTIGLDLLRLCVSFQRNYPNPNDPRAACLSSLAAPSIRTASMASDGYVPIVLIWAIMSNLPKEPHLQNLPKVLAKHETFTHTFGDSIHDPVLEDALVKLFEGIFSAMVRENSQLSPESTYCKEIEKLDREAEELEKRSKEVLAVSQHKTVMSTMDKMASEISDMRQQITQLTNTVQLLLDLQQKPDTTGDARPSSPASAERVNGVK